MKAQPGQVWCLAKNEHYRVTVVSVDQDWVMVKHRRTRNCVMESIGIKPLNFDKNYREYNSYRQSNN